MKEYFGRDLEAMSFAHNYHKWILTEFSPYLGDIVAEVGAGMGNFSEFLLGDGIQQLVSFEPSENMFGALQERLLDRRNADTVNAYFEEKSHLYKNHFDSICYVNVLEHIEDEENALSHAYNALRKSGHILIFVPALPCLYSNLDRNVGHFRRHTKRSLSNVVQNAGFSIKKAHYFDMLGIIPWYIAFVLLKRTITASNVSAYDKSIIPVTSRIERLARPIIGKNLILIGEKP
jgi:SAM-dependent methyltransferase